MICEWHSHSDSLLDGADLLIGALQMLNDAVRPDDFVNVWPESPISYDALYGPGLTRPAARALMPNTERSVKLRQHCHFQLVRHGMRTPMPGCAFNDALAGPPGRTWCAYGARPWN